MGLVALVLVMAITGSAMCMSVPAKMDLFKLKNAPALGEQTYGLGGKVPSEFKGYKWSMPMQSKSAGNDRAILLTSDANAEGKQVPCKVNCYKWSMPMREPHEVSAYKWKASIGKPNDEGGLFAKSAVPSVIDIGKRPLSEPCKVNCYKWSMDVAKQN